MVVLSFQTKLALKQPHASIRGKYKPKQAIACYGEKGALKPIKWVLRNDYTYQWYQVIPDGYRLTSKTSKKF
jgi:hypothetical protein